MERRTTTKSTIATAKDPDSSSSSPSSGSDFEFTISFSPRKASVNLCPADELFYKGQILPLHHSPRLSMVRTLTTSTCFSDDTTNTDSRHSTGSSNSSSTTDSNNSSISNEFCLLAAAECESSRTSSSTNEDHDLMKRALIKNRNGRSQDQNQTKKLKYFSFSRLSSVFKKDGQAVSNNKNRDYDHDQQPQMTNATSTDHFSMKKRMSNSAKEMIRKYLKKVKPLYEKLSQKQQQKIWASSESLSASSETMISDRRAAENTSSIGEILLLSSSSVSNSRKEKNGMFSHSFSGNLRYPRRRRRSSCVSSCPSSMRSSPSHSGVLCRSSVVGGSSCSCGSSGYNNNNKLDCSSMEELQSAIQGAIAHCKNSMMREDEGHK